MINVVGLGYIGLPTALMLASHGNQVVGTDYNPTLVSHLKAGIVTFKEKGLDNLFNEALKGGITFSTEYQSAQMYIISVPTPYDKDTKQIDATYVVEAVKSVLEVCPEDAVLVIESTISPNTIDRYIRPIIGQSRFTLGQNIHLAHAPERIIPGNMMEELTHNNRTIGADSAEVAERVKKVYASFCQGEIVQTDIRSAEMSKVVENTFRAVNIALANELSRICRHDGLDVYEIIRICNMHPRVNIMNPGPGVGGHCIPIDPWFLVGDYPQLTPLIEASMKVNQSQPDFVLQRIQYVMQKNGLTDAGRVGLYGLTYKENVDDFRESPTLQLLEAQKRHLAAPLKCYDPMLGTHKVTESQMLDFDAFVDAVDLVVIMVKHDHLRQNWQRLQGKLVLDCHHVCPLPNTYYL